MCSDVQFDYDGMFDSLCQQVGTEFRGAPNKVLEDITALWVHTADGHVGCGQDELSPEGFGEMLLNALTEIEMTECVFVRPTTRLSMSGVDSIVVVGVVSVPDKVAKFRVFGVNPGAAPFYRVWPSPRQGLPLADFGWVKQILPEAVLRGSK
jgi:hypothetical protein